MPVRLWHFTRDERAVSILDVGFCNGEFNYVQFTQAGDTSYEDRGPALIEVTLDVTDGELEREGYRRLSLGRERWSEQVGGFVKINDPAHYRRFLTYDIPADFVNGHTMSIRLVPREEYRRPTSGD